MLLVIIGFLLCIWHTCFSMSSLCFADCFACFYFQWWCCRCCIAPCWNGFGSFEMKLKHFAVLGSTFFNIWCQKKWWRIWRQWWMWWTTITVWSRSWCPFSGRIKQSTQFDGFISRGDSVMGMGRPQWMFMVTWSVDNGGEVHDCILGRMKSGENDKKVQERKKRKRRVLWHVTLY